MYCYDLDMRDIRLGDVSIAEAQRKAVAAVRDRCNRILTELA